VADGTAELPFGIYIVADGMGGHEHGEIASGIAVRASAQYLMNKLYSALLGIHPEPQSESLQEIMEAAVRQAHTAVVREAPGGGTTLTIALMIGEQVTLGHLGDSRAYFLYPDGRMQTMTSDHSVVGRLVEMGQLTEEEALVHPRRHILYRAVGLDEPHRPDIATHLMPHPGTIMICSDGLWSVVPQLEILRIIKAATNLTEACQKLVEAANDAGGPDNITVVMVQYLA
jgi:serine/threonine protein phosphatase PrpC